MTPKEKAEELIIKFLSYVDNRYWYNGEKVNGNADFKVEKAKECALIAVDELINNLVYSPTDYGASITFWQQVKKEIEKL